MGLVRCRARNIPLSAILFALVLSLCPNHAQAQHGNMPGWVAKPTRFAFNELIVRLEGAVKAHEMVVVNFASASEGAKTQNLTIPGNRVVGVFRNDFARRLLPLNLKAGIEAPIRFYLTEGVDGLASLSYKTPTAVLEPYFQDSPMALQSLAKELDVIFYEIARDAVGQ